jgi:hypothetical protein
MTNNNQGEKPREFKYKSSKSIIEITYCEEYFAIENTTAAWDLIYKLKNDYDALQSQLKSAQDEIEKLNALHSEMSSVDRRNIGDLILKNTRQTDELTVAREALQFISDEHLCESLEHAQGQDMSRLALTKINELTKEVMSPTDEVKDEK